MKDHAGTSQSERFLSKLKPEYFQVDEKTLNDFFDFVTKYSKVLSFYNINNQVDGDWETFFYNNITILLAQLSSVDVEKMESDFNDIVEEVLGKSRTNSERPNLDKPLKFLYELCVKIESWRQRTGEIKEFHDEIQKLIQFKISIIYMKLRAYESKAFEQLASGEVLYTDFPDLLNSKDWMSSDIMEDTYTLLRETNTKELRASIKYFYNVFHSLLSNVKQIVKSSSNYLEQHLKSGHIQPYLGLFIAFLEIYKHAQKELNKFTYRHLEFYYKEILKFNQKNEIPDKVNLICQLQNGVEVHKIEKDIALFAGKDVNSKDLIYKVDHEVYLNSAEVGQLKTVAIDTMETKFEPTKGIEIESFLIDEAVVSKVTDTNIELLTPKDKLGFALSTPILKLEEGQRQIKITFDFQKHSFDKFVNKAFKAIINDPIIPYANLEDLFYSFFIITYSTNKGWHNVPKNKVRCTFKKDNFEKYISQIDLFITLEPVDPPVHILVLDDYPEVKEKKLPIFQFFINPEKTFLYNYFKQIIIERIHIDVDVFGVKKLILQNDFGQLDATTPFDPFSAIPILGSNFYIGHGTIFSQPLSKLNINIEWYDLPINANGFAEYYEAYSHINSNDIFKARFSILKDKKWLPFEQHQELDLFEDVQLDDQIEYPVSNFRNIDNIDIKRFNLDFVNASNSVNTSELYNEDTINGFIKLELSNPPNAFGHKEYPELLKSQIPKNIKKISTIPIPPNEPHSPTIKSISVDYATSSTINLKVEDKTHTNLYYHLHPYGQLLVKGGVDKLKLLPYYEKGSEIYLGINSFESIDSLSILFQIDEFATDFMSRDAKIEWSYLLEDEWIKFQDDRVIRDTTNNLNNSGIVVLSFPEVNIENLQSELLPSGFFWIKCKSGYGIKFVENIINIKCQAFSAVFENNGNDLSHLITNLPPESILRFVEEDDNVMGVFQPYASYGGRKQEDDVGFYSRISERLRHKNRAITRWDYERIILQEFPDVFRAICLNCTNTTLNLKIEPGTILIVILPVISDLIADKIIEPKLTVNKLQSIRNYISAKISPFVNLDVRNPIYEEVQIKFDVKFNKGYNEKYYLRQVNSDLKKLLNPWLFEDNAVLEFSTSLRGATVLYFLETREYVDYFTNFAIYHIVNGQIINHSDAQKNDAILEPTTPISIFISVDNHIIDLVKETIESEDKENAMVVGSDFMINVLHEKVKTEGVDASSVNIDFSVDKTDKIVENKGNYLITIKK